MQPGAIHALPWGVGGTAETKIVTAFDACLAAPSPTKELSFIYNQRVVQGYLIGLRRHGTCSFLECYVLS